MKAVVELKSKKGKGWIRIELCGYGNYVSVQERNPGSATKHSPWSIACAGSDSKINFTDNWEKLVNL